MNVCTNLPEIPLCVTIFYQTITKRNLIEILEKREWVFLTLRKNDFLSSRSFGPDNQKYIICDVEQRDDGYKRDTTFGLDKHLCKITSKMPRM